MPTRGPCPNVGITRTAVQAHNDHRSLIRKQRVSLKQWRFHCPKWQGVLRGRRSDHGKVREAKWRQSMHRREALHGPFTYGRNDG